MGRFADAHLLGSPEPLQRDVVVDRRAGLRLLCFCRRGARVDLADLLGAVLCEPHVFFGALRDAPRFAAGRQFVFVDSALDCDLADFVGPRLCEPQLFIRASGDPAGFTARG